MEEASADHIVSVLGFRALLDGVVGLFGNFSLLLIVHEEPNLLSVGHGQLVLVSDLL